MINLKRCPFCGGEATIITGVSVDVENFRVKCRNCEVSTPVYWDIGKDCSALEVAVHMWNRRANDD